MVKYNRVALINTRAESRQRIPIGLLLLAACVRDMCEVRVFDPDPDDYDLQDVVDFQPDLVGFGFMTQTRNLAREKFQKLRERLSGVTFAVGGVGPTVEPERVFEMFEPDICIVGEAEKTFERIVKGDELDNIPGIYMPGRAYTPPDIYMNLDDIPLPAYDLMPDFKKYLLPPGGIRGKWFNRGSPMIMSARGCPYKCTFCSSCLMFTRKVRRRSVQNVIEEIRKLHYEYGANAVYFFDDTFNVKNEWVKEFCEALKQEPYKLTWGCQVRVNLVSEEQASMMKEAGCVQVDIGVESGSPKVLKAIQKGETVEQIKKAFAVLHRVGISPMATFLVGCPEETMEDVEMTKLLLKEIKPSFAEFFYLIPYPGSELYRQAVEHNWIVDNSYEGRGMVDRPVLKINFSLDEQREIRRQYFNMMAARNLMGYFSFNVLMSVVLNIRPVMIRAFIKEYFKTKNTRDAMQAYVHALRRYCAEKMA